MRAVAALLFALGGCIELPAFFEAEQEVATADASEGDVSETGLLDTLGAGDNGDVADDEVLNADKPGMDLTEADVDAEVDAIVGPQCGSAVDCDDSNVCTLDACDDGQCAHTPTSVGGSCDDGFPCTLSDACNALGQCSGDIVVCDDGNPCTQDSCDPDTGACTTEPVPDGQSCSLGANTCNEACTDGVCGCVCPSDETLTLTLSPLDISVAGTIVLNPSGNAIDDTYQPLPSAGPLACAGEWLSGSNLLPQAAGYPIIMEWTRPCTGPDPLRDRAKQYEAAGGTYWKARDVEITEAASLKIVTDTHEQFVGLPNFHVIDVSPSVEQCTTQEVVTMRANNPDDLYMRIDVGGLGAFRLNWLTISIKGNPDVQLASPLDWSPFLVPNGGDSATLTILNPCGGPVTDPLFGGDSLELWGATSRSGSLEFVGFDSTYLGAANFYGGIVTQAGTCVNGQRASTVKVDLLDAIQ